MQILKDISLQEYNTFHLDVKASQWIDIQSIDDLKKAIDYIEKEGLKYYVLGEGSNTLFTRDFEGVILQMNISGKEIIRQNERKVLVKAAAGESWHEFVLWTLAHNFSGIENLALIPGKVGSAPIQNIGAYGVEVKDLIECVEVLEVKTLKIKKIVNSDCEFGYRDSWFKRNKGKYIITAVNFNFKKTQHTEVNTSYGAIQNVLLEKNIEKPTAKDVAEAVISIRQAKLPDPKILGNAGSFFKNPVVKKEVYDDLKIQYQDIPSFTVSEDLVKIPAGWLIEKCGFKGKRFGNVGVHEHQALVIVNYGNATGEEILALATKIQKTVADKFGITIEPEVNVV